MSKRERLEALAETRQASVKIEGEKYLIRESSAIAFADWGMAMRAGEKHRAIAYLLADSLLEEDGKPMYASVDEALKVARNQRTAAPLVSAILELGGFGGDTEKEPNAG